jgi:bacterioferritin
LISELNKGVAAELHDAYRYLVLSKMASGPRAGEVSELFARTAQDEWSHLGVLIDRILQLGGRPITRPSEAEQYTYVPYKDPPEDPTDLKRMVEDSLEGERAAIRYWQALFEKTQHPDPVTRSWQPAASPTRWVTKTSSSASLRGGSRSVAQRTIHHVVPGVFTNREDAEAAIVELRELGLMDEDIGLAVPDPERHGLEAESRTLEELKGTATGIAVGGTLGTLAGLAITGAFIAGAGVIGLGGLILGGVGGALWGAFAGAFGGFLAKVRMNPDEDIWYEIPLKSGDILLVAHAKELANEAHEVMHRHHVRCFVGETCPESH